MKIKGFNFFVLTALFFTFLSCTNILTDDSKSSSANADKVSVSFNFSSVNRTALPSVDLTNYVYIVQYKLSSETEYTISSAFSGNNNISLSLAAGTYDFTVNVYNSSDTSFSTPVLTGSSTGKAISSSSNTVSIVLSAVTGGTGTVSITLNIAKSLSVTKVSAVLSDSITNTDSGTKTAVTNGTTYDIFTYSNTEVPSGVSKYVIFFLYDSSENLVTTYVDSVYVVSGLTSSDTYTINGTTFIATVTVQKNGTDWTDSGLEVTLVNTADSSDTVTMTATTGEATYTGNAASASTYTVYFGGQATSKTVSSSSSSAALNYLVPVLYPEQGATDAFTDTQLVLTFESEPSLVSDTAVTISDSSSTVDTITVNSTTADESQSTQSGYTVNVGNQQLVRTDGNSVYIQPHYNGTTSATVLQGLTTYTVDVSDIIDIPSSYDGFLFEDGTTDWSFTTKATASAASTMTVSNATSGNTADFFSVYGALFAAANKSSGTYEIDIAATGTPYYELISVQGKGAHIILKGQGTATYGNDVVIEYVNNQYLSAVLVASSKYSSQAQRASFYYKGGNLTLENVVLKNLTQRKTVYSSTGKYYDASITYKNSTVAKEGAYQAEAFYFASGAGKTFNAYNSSFVSLQDTILTAGDKAWFYGCYVAGDVDFMWGTSSVALFENCAIECLNTSATAAYLFETRVGSTSGTSVGKGYVLLNSTVTVDSGVTAYYARRATGKSSTSYYDQVAIVNTTFSGSGSLAAARWYVGNEPEYLSSTLYGSSADVGWKEYGVTNSTATSATTSTSAYGTITDTEYTNEYSGRHAILNRYYDITNACYAKDSTTNWDIDTLISDRGYSVADDSSSETLSGEAVTTSVVYDFSSANPTTYTDLTCTSIGWNNSAYASGGNGSSISFAVTDACTVTVYYCYAASGTITAGSQSSTSFSTSSSSTSQIDSTVYEVTAASTVTVAYTGTTYLTKIVVTYTSGGGSSSEEDDEDTIPASWTWSATNYGTGITTDQTSCDSGTELGYVSVFGTGALWRVSNSSVYCLQTGKADAGCLAFTTSATATITIEAASTGTSNTSDAILSTSASSTGAIAEDSGATTVTGSGSKTTLTYSNVAAGTYYFGAFPASSNARGTRVYTITVTAGTASVSSVSISGSTSVKVGSSVTLTATPNVTPSDSTYTWTVTDSGNYVTYTASTTNTLTLTGSQVGSVMVTAAVDGVTSDVYTVAVKESSENAISASDTPVGWASVSADSSFGNYNYTVKTVSSKSDFVTYAEAGGYLIYVNGTIDLSEGMLPSSYDGTTSELNSFIAAYSGYSTYDAWKIAYAGECSKTTNDKSSTSPETNLGSTLWTMSNAYKEIVQVDIASNTMIIGLDGDATIKGGCLMINGKSNVTLRNLTIQDAYDPFPHHEKNDGFNAQYDCITVQGTCSHIWIDHCTIQDTLKDHEYVTLSDGSTTEKWQIYDGLCDMKGALTYATVSYCKFSSHDKTMLIGSSDTESFSGTRTVTLHHNYFDTCVQRLPMVRLTDIHIFNNYYDFTSYSATKKTLDSSGNASTTTEEITSGYGIGVRCNSNIISERNYFSSGMQYAYAGDSATSSVGDSKTDCVSTTLIYINDDSNNSKSTAKNSSYYTVTETMPWTPSDSYSYTLDAVDDIPTSVSENAGAGVWSVEQ